MEVLKNLEEILKPDPRIMCFKMYDESLDDYRNFTINDFHETASSLKLNSSIPEDIQSILATALNLWVYSWFYYPFNAESGFIAYRALENALGKTLGLEQAKSGLHSLLEEAVKRELLKEEKFTRNETPQEFKDFIEKQTGKPYKAAPDTFIEDLPRILSRARNSYAHGELNIHHMGIQELRLVIEAINQLFPI